MPISKKIAGYLVKSGYKYEVISHRTTYTAWDTAQTEHVKPQEVAKALVLKSGNDWMVALLPSDRKLDKAKFLKAVNAEMKKKGEKMQRGIELAKEPWMKKNAPGKIGATPPFRGILKKDIYIDKLLLKNKKVYLGSGEYDISIRVAVNQYVKKEKPIIGSFSVKK
ncbi:MAG: YbaK/EbsC family protein [Candidatus Moranbacteria bacterium]|nr:YbaK/EbsC family protein [Candidatus Moranbacteria bacterium]